MERRTRHATLKSPPKPRAAGLSSLEVMKSRFSYWRWENEAGAIYAHDFIDVDERYIFAHNKGNEWYGFPTMTEALDYAKSQVLEF